MVNLKIIRNIYKVYRRYKNISQIYIWYKRWVMRMNNSLIMNFKDNQKGTTLIELLISVFILTFIVGTFLSIYVYSTKTNMNTNELMDGTYVAQTCMEEVYALSKASSVTSLSEMESSLSTRHYIATVSGTNYTFTKEIDGFYAEIRIYSDTYTSAIANMYKLVITTYHDAAHTKSAAKMQNIITID